MASPGSKDSRRFYLYTSLFILSGWLWLIWSAYGHWQNGFSVCFIRNTTGIPCPACGSTGSVLLIMEGNWGDALYANPLGYLLVIGLVLAPLWLIADLASGRSSLHNMMHRFDNTFRRKPILLLLILLPVLLNWIWNIMKM